MSDSDGEDGFRGAALMADLGVIERVGTIWSAEATSNPAIEIAYPGISTWKITAIGKTAHPTEPEHGINAVTKMAKLVAAVDEGRLRAAGGRLAVVRAAGHDQRRSAPVPGGGWAIPGRCDAVLSVLSPAGASLNEVRDAIDGFLRMLEQEDGEVRFERKILPMGAGRLWLRPGEVDPEHPGVKALDGGDPRARPAGARGAQVQRRLGRRGRADAPRRRRLRRRRRRSPSAPATSNSRTPSTSTSRSPKSPRRRRSTRRRP